MERYQIKKYKIAVLTGTRAEYGILKSLLFRIKTIPEFDLHLIITGMHLSDEFGLTIKDIEKDGFLVYDTVNTLNTDDSGRGMAEYIGNTTSKLAQVLGRVTPDVLILIGDRGEMLAGAIAATCMNVLVAHIHGGDTSGSVDEDFRNAISKLAQVHFTPTNETKRKLLKNGVELTRIFVVGTLALDGLREKLIAPKEIALRFGVELTKPIVLVTQHSTVTEAADASNQMKETLEAIVTLGFQTIIVYPNADAGGREIIRIIKDYGKKYSFIKAYKSLPREDFLSLINISSVMIGNSSSGIIEAPAIGTPVINIGNRQRGRMRAGNIIDVDHNKNEILNAVKIALSASFKKKMENIINPWKSGDTTEEIVKILLSLKVHKKKVIAKLK